MDKKYRKRQRYNIIAYTTLIISIILFNIFLYLVYKIKLNGEISPIILILSISTFITFIIFYKKSRNLSEEINYTFNTEENNKSKYHVKAKTITDNEKYFLDIIKKHFKQDYDIRIQVPLSSVIEKEKEFERQYQNELNRIIDIGIFDKDTSYPLLLIEINDPTHFKKDRQVRDAKVKNICDQAGIKLIAFWTNYSNTEEYILNRVNTNLRDSN